jgi:hypothetical protein
MVERSFLFVLLVSLIGGGSAYPELTLSRMSCHIVASLRVDPQRGVMMWPVVTAAEISRALSLRISMRSPPERAAWVGALLDIDTFVHLFLLSMLSLCVLRSVTRAEISRSLSHMLLPNRKRVPTCERRCQEACHPQSTASIPYEDRASTRHWSTGTDQGVRQTKAAKQHDKCQRTLSWYQERRSGPGVLKTTRRNAIIKYQILILKIIIYCPISNHHNILTLKLRCRTMISETRNRYRYTKLTVINQ